MMPIRRLAMATMIGGLAACSTFTGGALYEEGEPWGSLIVDNRSGIEIDTLTLSRCNAMSHGLDRLAGGQTIPNNSSMRFKLSAGCWDIMVGRAGSCAARPDGGQSCRWTQSPSRKFEVAAGTTQTISYEP